MKHSGLVLVALLIAAAALAPAPRGARDTHTTASASVAPALAWVETDDSLALRRGEQTLWRLRFADGIGKPHFDVLAAGEAGGSLLGVRPDDHPWHYGLWLSWKFIDGVNYWEEDRTSGEAAGATRVTRSRATPRADHSARVELELSYVPRGTPPADAHLTERRVIEVHAPGPDGSLSIDWTSVFTARGADVELDRTPLPDEPGGRAYGGYAGLSLRLADLERRVVSSPAGLVAFNAEQRFRGRARALDYSGAIDGDESGVAVLDDPRNPDAPTPWYAIRSDAMTFFSPAFICYGPRTLEAGDELRLSYRIVAHPGRWSAARLREAWREWTDGIETGEPSP